MSVQSDRAQFPALAPPPFDYPMLSEARRVTGFIVDDENPEEDVDSSKDSEKVSFTDVGTSLSEYGNTSIVLDAPELKRSQTLSGNLLAIGGTKYLIQRKIRNTAHGSARIGYILQPTENDSEKSYKLKRLETDDATSQYEMLTIQIQEKATYESGQFSEQAALQMIASNNQLRRLQGASVIAACTNQVYALTPFYKDGSLFDHCAQNPGSRLSETDARSVFKQLLEVSHDRFRLSCSQLFFSRMLNLNMFFLSPSQALESLQVVELCHRNISLENVMFHGKECYLTAMEYAIRIPKADGAIHMIEPQPVGGNISPQFCAPELLKEDPFDGYAVDLWSVGVVLFAMLFGVDALWAAPVVEDRTFHQVCIKRDLKGFVEFLQSRLETSETGKVSDNALELLQTMLIVEGKERCTLTQVLQHPWVTTT